MEVKLEISINMRNGDKKSIISVEKDPKGYLVNEETGDKKEISLTDKEVQIEYTKKIAENMEKKRPLFFIDAEDVVYVVNSYDISSIDVRIA